MIVQTVIATDLITPLGAYLRLRETGSASFLLESVLRASGRARYLTATDEEALAAFRRLAETEGILPALEPAHALARVGDLDAELIVLCLSGRGEKDLAQVTG
ncbi:MAG TPA: hypothetical protein VFL61_12730 [Gaiellaceae bacterium]|nr:hypothetical protein [Gaiellaceae bacterium]